MDGQKESGSAHTTIGLQRAWTDPLPLQLEGWFRHESGEELLYVSRLLGRLNLTVHEDEGYALQCQFQAGIGKRPRGLSTLFWSTSQERPAGTSSFPCIMAAPWVTARR